ncbi:MAG: hypothetical protein H6726_17615 [Sandaracinaceae bacterium]|nr:hypothetical protein [Sandaracinaceae bacterium]
MVVSVRSPSPASLTVLHQDATLSVGAYANVHLCVYRGELTLSGLETANDHHRALMARHPRTLVLGLAQHNLPLPSAEVRQRGAHLIDENGSHVLAAAMVLAGTGFWASAVRSVMTASFALARQPYPSKAFATGVEAGEWLSRFDAGTVFGPEALAQALERLERA